jgi:hypothetical protein
MLVLLYKRSDGRPWAGATIGNAVGAIIYPSVGCPSVMDPAGNKESDSDTAERNTRGELSREIEVRLGVRRKLYRVAFAAFTLVVLVITVPGAWLNPQMGATFLPGLRRQSSARAWSSGGLRSGEVRALRRSRPESPPRTMNWVPEQHGFRLRCCSDITYRIAP